MNGAPWTGERTRAEMHDRIARLERGAVSPALPAIWRERLHRLFTIAGPAPVALAELRVLADHIPGLEKFGNFLAGDDLPPLSEEEKAAERAAEAEAKAKADAALAEVAASKAEAANGAGDTAAAPPAGTTPPRPA